MWLLEKARYNTTFEFATKENNHKVRYIKNFRKRNDQIHYNLAMEKLVINPNNVLKNNLSLQNTYIFKTLRQALVSLKFPVNLFIPTKLRNLIWFTSNIIINLPKNLNGIKKPVADGLFLLKQLFLSKKLTKVNSLDYKLLMQMIKKIKSFILLF